MFCTRVVAAWIATDAFMVTGHVYPEIERPYQQYAYRGPRLLFRNLGNGHFEEMLDGAGPALGQFHASRGCAFGDFDNDGDVDIVIVNLNEPPSLLRNDASGVNRWLKVKLVGATSNRSAIGARVTVTAGASSQTQEWKPAPGAGDRIGILISHSVDSRSSVSRSRPRSPLRRSRSILCLRHPP